MSKANFLKVGDHNAICDICGFKFKASDLMKQWDGLRVCKEDFSVRHPQEFVRGRKDDQSVPWTRAEGTDVETDTSGWADTKTTVPSGTNSGDL